MQPRRKGCSALLTPLPGLSNPGCFPKRSRAGLLSSALTGWKNILAYRYAQIRVSFPGIRNHATSASRVIACFFVGRNSIWKTRPLTGNPAFHPRLRGHLSPAWNRAAAASKFRCVFGSFGVSSLNGAVIG